MYRTVFFAAALTLMAGPAARGQLDPNAFPSLGTLSVPSGTLTIDTDALTVSGAASFTGVAITQTSGPQVAVFDFSSITIGSGVTVSFSGSRPLALLTVGSATIQTTMTVSTVSGTDPPVLGGYAGGYATVLPNTGATQNGGGPGGGEAILNASRTAGSVGGGGYGGMGGQTLGGLAYGNLFQTLQGGSGGGALATVGSGGLGTAVAGAGGGALEIVAAKTLAIAGVTASGRDGSATNAGAFSGFSDAGGGAGGGILLSGGTGLTVTGTLDAHGGDGNTAFGNAGGGGGGRIALSGLSSYMKCAPGAGPVTCTLLVMPGSVSDASRPSFVLASV